MKQVRHHQVQVRGKKGSSVPFLPTPNQAINTTISSPTSASSSDSEAALSGLKTSVAQDLDRRSAEFYLALCKLYEESKVNPVIALHATELFVQSVKRAERARLGVHNPEGPE